MTKFDEAVMTMTAGITDPTELQAAQMRAETLLADKQALARSRAQIKISDSTFLLCLWQWPVPPSAHPFGG